MRGDYSEIVRTEIGGILQGEGSGDDVGKYRECQRVIGEIIEEIRVDLQGEPFADLAAEIAFFKKGAPGIWGQYFFYGKLVEIEACRKFQMEEAFRSGLKCRLQGAEAYLEKQVPICTYYYSGRTDADERLFTRHGTHNAGGAAIDMRIDRNFTKGAWLLSRVRGHELLRDWLTKELEGPAEGEGLPDLRQVKKLDWHISTTEAVELFKALHLKKCFGEVPFKEVMEWVEVVTGVDPGAYESSLQNIRYRKGETAKFLEGLVKGFKHFIDSKQ